MSMEDEPKTDGASALASVLASLGGINAAIIASVPAPTKVAIFSTDVGLANAAQVVNTFQLPGQEDIRSIFVSNHASANNIITVYAGTSPSGRIVASVPGGAWKRHPISDNTKSVTLLIPVSTGTGSVGIILSSGLWSPSEGVNV